MHVPFRRPGVPTKHRETAFVSHLVAEGFGVAQPAPMRISPEQLASEAKRAIRAAGGAAFDAEIKAMTDGEFEAWLAAEGLSPSSYLADPFKAVRK